MLSASTLLIDLPDADATEALGRRLGLAAQGGDVIALSGPLGAGKTSLARGFIQAATGFAEEVPSPTFTLVQTYDAATGPIWHVDLYRLERPDDIWELGIEEAFGRAILLIEWPERMGAALPARRTGVDLAEAGRARRASLTASGGDDLLARAGFGVAA